MTRLSCPVIYENTSCRSSLVEALLMSTTRVSMENLPSCNVIITKWAPYPSDSLFTDPPTYAESIGGAVTLWDDDDDDTDSPEQNMGDLTYTPMYTYVYNYRPPPAYTEVVQVS